MRGVHGGDDAPPPPPPEVADRAKRKQHSLWTRKNSDHRSVVLGQLERMALATKDTQQSELPRCAQRVALPKERPARATARSVRVCPPAATAPVKLLCTVPTHPHYILNRDPGAPLALGLEPPPRAIEIRPKSGWF